MAPKAKDKMPIEVAAPRKATATPAKMSTGKTVAKADANSNQPAPQAKDRKTLRQIVLPEGTTSSEMRFLMAALRRWNSVIASHLQEERQLAEEEAGMPVTPEEHPDDFVSGQLRGQPLEHARIHNWFMRPQKLDRFTTLGDLDTLLETVEGLIDAIYALECEE